MKKITEATIAQGTRVFVSTDIDVPIDNGHIRNTFRLDRGLETLKYIVDKGAIPVIGGHIKNPQGKYDPQLSTAPLKKYYNEKLGEGSYELLENLRFDIREDQNEDTYAQELANKTEVFVNENFATSHRTNASLVAITKYLPSFAGLNLSREIEALDKILIDYKKPFTAVIGGAKVESKAPVIDSLCNIADNILLGGKIGLNYSTDNARVSSPADYADGNQDIGPKTILNYTGYILSAQTLLWAGPMGAYEKDEFCIGTNLIADAIVEATKGGAYSIIGGGDTITAYSKNHALGEVSFVSTGGGAMLTYLAHKNMPGIEALG
ncbi:phosphoglycerate kinase [Candidatus Nomurabacteria bacterium]|uniref:Phosphoglycerate kinase n=1 Tax=candidate division WWE3 bacterium TaxID=2053526 RepID=A0A955E0J7_UNCKA|nr:phosphoglycerate kinase [candidate division WWE3 bacterium]MCB9823800.1 phosphoglycerate kinase [Candidatus Nomurabacteria bacterium]MCB9826794.1 phosphoglycerate kinase [Candidatus Nomurabacteria bacterium]MCB9827595.1 phosphoglycerate kinase [Candidatus Nomurabacteria bacterium]HXK52724.1 phosphoglycerate kinase [bacterium]